MNFVATQILFAVSKLRGEIMQNEKDRNEFIGSSDISAILGLDRNRTQLTVWAEKTGQIPPLDLSQNEAVEWGRRMEKSRVIAEKFEDIHGLKLRTWKERYYHAKYAYLSCELDYIITNTDELVEVKNRGYWKAKEYGDNEMMQEEICQIQWALGISGRKKGWLAVLCGGQKYIEREILFDEKMFEIMVKKAVDFWEKHVIPKVMPAQISCNDTDTLYQLFPQEKEGSIIELGDDIDAMIESLQAQKQDLKSLEMSIEKHENEIKAMLREAEIGLTPHYKISWKNQSRKNIDTKKLREEIPDVAAKYEREVANRYFRIAKISQTGG